MKKVVVEEMFFFLENSDCVSDELGNIFVERYLEDSCVGFRSCDFIMDKQWEF